MTANPIEGIEDIYSLTSTQRGMLFHRLYHEGARTYFVQARMRVDGALDGPRFRAAWQVLLDRHAALRTLFVWEGVAEPLQVVRRVGSVQLDWAEHDLRGVDPAQHEETLETFFEKDYHRGFDLRRAPLFRVTVLHLRDHACCVWSHEHLILDGWCLPLLIDELLEVYAALGENRAPQLLPQVPFREHVSWSASQNTAAAQRFFCEMLDSPAEPSPLPLDRASAIPANDARSEDPGFAELSVRLTETDTHALESFARRVGVTLSTVLQAAWAQVLARYAGRDEAIFGVTVSGRAAEAPGAERIVGPCISTLPLRVPVKPAQRIEPWLRDVQQRSLRLREHATVGLPDIQRALAKPSPSAEPPRLFESIVVFENYPTRPLERASIAIRPWQLDAHSEAARRSAERNNYPLTLVVAPDKRLWLILAFAGQRMEAADGQRVLDALVTTLRAFCQPGVEQHPLGTLPPSSNPVLCGPKKETSARSVLEAFRRIVEHQPDALAVVSGEQHLSYHELDVLTARIARGLRAHLGDSFRIGSRVAVCTPRDHRSIAAMLGVLRAGGTYVPLDPEQPASRRTALLQDAAPVAFVLAGDVWQGTLPNELRCLDLDLLEAKGGGKAPALPPPHPEQIAYVLYTSGSTGRPKGVEVSHRALIHYVDGIRTTLGFAPGLQFALVSPPTVDLGHTSTFGSLCTGGTLHVITPEACLDGASFASYQQRHAIDVLKIAPSQLSVLLDTGEPRQILPSRHLIVGGETLPPQLWKRLIAYLPSDCRITNHYGPTEATVGAFSEPHAKDQPLKAPGIGTPLPGVRAQIVDRHGRGVPRGAAGELCLSGEGLAQGYLGHAAWTAQHFVPDPEGRTPGARRYRTGDRVRHRGGRLDLLGRLDQQLNLLGQRVEPGEITAVLRKHQSVADAVVRGHPRADGAHDTSCTALVAYVVSATGTNVRPLSLREHLLEHLPAAWIPSQFVMLDALPLLPSGKLDVQKLPAPELNQESPVNTSPRDAVEEQLAELWAEVLRRTQPSVNDSFFALGGDSILCLQVVARARRRGLRFTPKDMFERPTIAQLAEVVRLNRPDQPELPPALSSDQPTRLGLSAIQARFFAQTRPQRDWFNQALLLRLPGSLELVRVREWLKELTHHHAALRTRFVQEDSGCVAQHVQPPAAPASLEHVDLSTLPAKEQTAAIETICAQAQQKLALETGKVFLGVWFDCGPHPGRLLLVAHHLVVDVISWGIILRDLRDFFAGRTRGTPGARLSQWVQRQQQLADSAQLAEEFPYWLKATHCGIPALQHGRSTVGARRECSVFLSHDATERFLRKAGQAYRTEPDDLLLAALAMTLGHHWGTRLLTIECEGHGRGQDASGLDLSDCVGWLTARDPLTLELSANAEPAVCIRNVKSRRRAVPRGGLGYGLLRYLRRIESPQLHRLRALPHPQLSFNNLGRLDELDDGEQPITRAPERLLDMRPPDDPRDQLLELTASIRDGTLELSWAYDPKFHALDEICTLAQTISTSLERLVDHCCAQQHGELRTVDVPRSGLSNEELTSLALDGRSVEDVLRCPPAQAGLLFEGLRTPGAYVNQLSVLMQDVDLKAWLDAWSTLLERHAILRTSFRWGTLPRPVQVVWRSGELPAVHVDWSGEEASVQATRWEQLLQEDRTQGFSIDRAPLWRLVFADCGGGRLRMLWSRHHGLLDGWCSARLLDELLQAYRALRERKRPALPPAPPYRNYIAWLDARDSQATARFWKKALANFRGPTPLPLLDTPDDEPTQFGRGMVQRTIDPSRWAELEEWARQRDLTPNTLCQAAFALLLSRCTRQQKAWLGVTVAGRPPDLEGAEHMLGLFINSLPLGVLCAPQQPLRSWMHDLQDAASAMREHAHTSLAELQASHGATLFHHLFVYENYPVEPRLRQAHGLSVEHTDSREHNHYPLTLVILPDPHRTTFRLEFAKTHYPQPKAEHLLATYERILRRLTTLPDTTPLGRVELPSETQPPHPPPPITITDTDTLAARFLQTAREHPQRVALCHGAHTLTYRELADHALRIAHALSLRGVGPEVRLGVRMQRGPRLVATLLGVLLAGGCYVPLHPELPPARQNVMAQDAKLFAVVHDGGPEIVDIPLWAADELLSQAPSSDYAAPYATSTDQLAYVIYTSGSTGTPKGVGISHRQVLTLFDSVARQHPFQEHDVWCLFHAYSFDFSVWELFGALLHGGQLVLVPENTCRDPQAFATLIEDHGVTVLNQTPSAFYALSAVLRKRTPTARTLHTVILGGEALDVQRLNDWWASPHSQHAQLINMYGITETTVHVTHAPVVPHSPPADIGRPLAHLHVRVLDPFLNNQPQHLPGELCIRGEGLARGYLERPALTAERFLPDPDGPPGSRFYRSGDLGVYDQHGHLRYLGRLDRQVQMRGYRIELDEIAAQLRRCHNVRDAIVILHEKSLLAFVTPEHVDPESILAQLADHLPRYMLPARIVPLIQFPTTAHQKLDEHALIEAARFPSKPDTTDDTPKTPLERTLTEIWRHVLQIDTIGLHDDFFALGGHSLHVPQICERVQQDLGVELSVAEMFRIDSVAQLVELIGPRLNKTISHPPTPRQA